MIKFKYKDKKRVAVDIGPDPRGCGQLMKQLRPVQGPRTFKPEKMSDVKKVGLLGRLFYNWTASW